MTTKKLNPNEAPPGYVAVAALGCNGCAFHTGEGMCSAPACSTHCDSDGREDDHSVIFIKREAESAALDARLTIRLPASVKAKAQRIGAAAVIAAIEAVEEGGAA